MDDSQKQSLTADEIVAIMPSLLDDEAKEKKLARHVAGLQAAVVLVVAGAAYILGGTAQFATALLSGGLVSVLNGVLLAWRMYRAALHPAPEAYHPASAHHQLRNMYLYAAERFLVVMALLGFCLAALKLSPLPVLGGFVIGQAVFLAARLFLNKLTIDLRP